MTGILDRLGRGSHVAIVRLRSLGDCVLTTPAIRLLKGARPDLKLGVVVEDRFRAIFEGNPDVEEILPPLAGALRRFGPDLCLNLHGGGTSARMTALSGARFRAGFAHFRFPFLYNVRIPKAQQTLGVARRVHTAEHVASAMFHLGVARTEIPGSRLFATNVETARAPYAVIHPMASEAAKTWPAEKFMATAALLKDTLDLEPVFIGGPGEDLCAFRRWTTRTLPLAETKRLLKQATVFLGNDSGPAHMAAAFQIPTVVLFGASDRTVWAPWRTPSEVLPLEASEGDVFEALTALRVHA